MCKMGVNKRVNVIIMRVVSLMYSLLLSTCLTAASNEDGDVRTRNQSYVDDQGLILTETQYGIPLPLDNLLEQISDSISDDHTKTLGPNPDCLSGSSLSELDMCLTPEQQRMFYTISPSPPPAPALPGRLRRQASANGFSLWKNGVIPYIFNTTFPAKDRDAILSAMAEWEQATCVRFRPANRVDRDIVIFRDGRRCSTNIGRIGREQAITLAKTCRSKRILVHELGHVIGLIHEHQRHDRDAFVKVLIKNVRNTSQERYQFAKLLAGSITEKAVNYDYTSVMHYGRNYFSRAPELTTLQTNDARYQDVIGRAEKPSFSDVETVNRLYRCSAGCPQSLHCSSNCYMDKVCVCRCPAGTEKAIFNGPGPYRNNLPDGTCDFFASQGDCIGNIKDTVRPLCAKSCGLYQFKPSRPTADTLTTSGAVDPLNQISGKTLQSSWRTAPPKDVVVLNRGSNTIINEVVVDPLTPPVQSQRQSPTEGISQYQPEPTYVTIREPVGRISGPSETVQETMSLSPVTNSRAALLQRQTALSSSDPMLYNRRNLVMSRSGNGRTAKLLLPSQTNSRSRQRAMFTPRSRLNYRQRDNTNQRSNPNLGSYDNPIRRSYSNLGPYDNTVQRSNSNQGSYDNTLQRPNSNQGFYDNTLQRSNSNQGLYDNTLQRSNSNLGPYDNTLQRSNSNLGLYDNTLRRSRSNSNLGSYDNTLQRSDSNLGVYDNTLRRSNSNLGPYDNTLQRSNSNQGSYGTFPSWMVRPGNRKTVSRPSSPKMFQSGNQQSIIRQTSTIRRSGNQQSESRQSESSQSSTNIQSGNQQPLSRQPSPAIRRSSSSIPSRRPSWQQTKNMYDMSNSRTAPRSSLKNVRMDFGPSDTGYQANSGTNLGLPNVNMQRSPRILSRLGKRARQESSNYLPTDIWQKGVYPAMRAPKNAALTMEVEKVRGPLPLADFAGPEFGQTERGSTKVAAAKSNVSASGMSANYVQNLQGIGSNLIPPNYVSELSRPMGGAEDQSQLNAWDQQVQNLPNGDLQGGSPQTNSLPTNFGASVFQNSFDTNHSPGNNNPLSSNTQDLQSGVWNLLSNAAKNPAVGLSPPVVPQDNLATDTRAVANANTFSNRPFDPIDQSLSGMAGNPSYVPQNGQNFGLKPQDNTLTAAGMNGFSLNTDPNARYPSHQSSPLFTHINTQRSYNDPQTGAAGVIRVKHTQQNRSLSSTVDLNINTGDQQVAQTEVKSQLGLTGQFLENAGNNLGPSYTLNTDSLFGVRNSRGMFSSPEQFWNGNQAGQR